MNERIMGRGPNSIHLVKKHVSVCVMDTFLGESQLLCKWRDGKWEEREILTIYLCVQEIGQV